MKVVCSKCGTMGEEDAMRCTSCGTTLVYNDMPDQINKKNKPRRSIALFDDNGGKNSNKSVMLVAIVAIAVIGLIGAGIAIIDANAYKSVIKDKLYAVETLDAEKIADTYPKFMYNSQSGYGYKNYADLVEELEWSALVYMEDDLFKKLEKKAGDNLKFSYKIEDVENLSDNKRKKFCEAIEQECDYNVKNITVIKKADITVKVKGSDDTYEFDWKDVYLIKDDGDWYLLNDDLENSSLGKNSDYHIDYYNYFKARLR